VEITYPLDGTIVYSELLYVSGTATDIPNKTFLIRLVGADDQKIVEAAVQPGEDGSWTVELAHGYNGEPMEMALLALPAVEDVSNESDYAIHQIVVAAQSYRPQGSFGSITSPSEGGTVGGESFEVTGTVSGVFENTFILALMGEDGTEIDMKPVTMLNPYFLDEVPWVAELETNGYTGSAVIEVYEISARDGSKIPFGSVRVTVVQEAG
jgi:hypothetical protein